MGVKKQGNEVKGISAARGRSRTKHFDDSSFVGTQSDGRRNYFGEIAITHRAICNQPYLNAAEARAKGAQ